MQLKSIAPVFKDFIDYIRVTLEEHWEGDEDDPRDEYIHAIMADLYNAAARLSNFPEEYLVEYP